MHLAHKRQITFLSNSHYLTQLANCKADAVVLKQRDLPNSKIASLVVKDPYLAYAKIAQILDITPKPAQNIHPSVELLRKMFNSVIMLPWC